MPINIASAAASVAVVGYALKRAGKSLDQKKIPLLGVVAAFIFAAQMLNFPVIAGTSGHFVGAVLAAVLLGPFEAVLVLALVLVLQCLMFADGGITALGSNIFNMGVVGALLGYAAFRGVMVILPKNKSGTLTAAAIAAWFSTVAAAVSCAVMLGASGRYPFELAVPAMAGVHALIGIGEAAITVVALALVMAARPELIAARPGASVQTRTAATGVWGVVVAGLGAAVVLAVIVSPYACSDPDGLEKKAIGESARRFVEAAKAEISKPEVVKVEVYANPGVAEEIENTDGEPHRILCAAGMDALAKTKVKEVENAEIFAGRVVSTEASGALHEKKFEQQGAVWTHSPIADYRLNISDKDYLKVGLAGLIGTILAFGIAFAMFSAVRGRKR
jgi:cobalt/nickel transport system permease protein